MPFIVVIPILLIMSGCGSQVSAPVMSRIDKVDAGATPVQQPQPALNTSGLHVVQQGETLYAIAFRYDLDYREVATWNDIDASFTIYPQQVLRLKPPPQVQQKPAASENVVPRPSQNVVNIKTKPVPVVKPVVPGPGPQQSANIVWKWPTSGQVIQLSSPTSQKGVNISGSVGQSIFAAAAGDVVYSGSGLLGYGNLVIIKHNDTYLSAYAHNEQILVDEGTKVKSGEKIATMGIDDERAVLHFEIRENGKPVNPLIHLPQNQS